MMSRYAPVLLVGLVLAVPALADPSAGELDFLVNQAKPAWLRQVEAKGAKLELVVVAVSLLPDGKIETARLAADEKRYDSDPQFRIVADAAVRSLLRASPLTPPAGHPEFFRNNPQITITFDPRSMR
jgi:hypothetical protein